MPLPRVLLAAPGSGHGKTTVASGLMAALADTGEVVAGFKVGPDYIDPGYHALATGRPGRNLDPHLCGEEAMVPLLRHGAITPTPADIAVIEGAMGLFDGRVGGEGYASSAHVAALTATPAILVVDVSATSRTAAALVHGLATYDPRVRVAGVILNRVGSPRHEAEVRSALARTRLPVLGALPRDPGVHAPSRHLGLIPTAERDDAALVRGRLADLVTAHCDLARIRAIAATAEPLSGPAWDPVAVVSPPSPRRPVVAVAAGRAFTFSYAETGELLAAAGCVPVEFDPLTDVTLPAGAAGIYLGGGFPEEYAAELADNNRLLAAVRDAVADGMPTVAECAGLLYLSRAVDGVPMVGALPVDAAMTPRLTLGYRTAVAPADTLLAAAGVTVTGHEFHRTALVGDSPGPPAWQLGDGRDGCSLGPAGLGSPTLHAAYLHTHWAGHPAMAQRYADAVHAYAASATAVPAHAASAKAEPNYAPSAKAVPRYVASVKAVPDGRRPEPQPAVRTDRPTSPDAHRHQSRAFASVCEETSGESARAAEIRGPMRGNVERRDVGRGDAAGEGAERDRHRDLRRPPAAHDLSHHGDADLVEGLVDLAVNVQVPAPPGWLADVIGATIADLAHYPRPDDAVAAIAAAHGVEPNQVLPTAGAAEAFTLIARALRPAWPVVVHPQFTEPEAALAAAGHRVRRLVLRAEDGFVLDPRRVPRGCDLLMLGNPTNPTSVLHPAATVVQLIQPGRVLVVDEAFMDVVPGQAESLLPGGRDGVRRDLGGVLVLRSLTKTWGLAGLRAGYLVGDAILIDRLRGQQPPWSVSTPALAATVACLSPRARASAAAAAVELAAVRAELVAACAEAGLPVAGRPAAPFILIDGWRPDRPAGWLRAALAEQGFAVRRGETFPGLDADWVRLAVRDRATTRAVAKALRVAGESTR